MSDDWRWERVTNYRKLQAMKRRQAWMAFVAKLEIGYYESWRHVVTDAPPKIYSIWKPWLYDWKVSS